MTATTAAERTEVHAVARFIAPRIPGGENWLVILACVSRRFPGVSLRSALAAYVFNTLLVAEEEPLLAARSTAAGGRMTAAARQVTGH